MEDYIYIKNNGIKINKAKQILILLILIFQFENIYKNEIKFYSSPKISIFLPIYNKANYLKKSIRSIQMQTLRNIEIIAVNDFSEDNTLEVLMNMSKKDFRIKIVNNNKNRGLLYSRAMGILNSRGEYLMNLDPDDEFKDSGNLEYLYKTAHKLKIDVISFGFIRKNRTNISKQIICSNHKYIYFQPEIINSYYNKIDYLIWNKLVKKEIFIKAYEIIKEHIYAEKWNYSEDEIWSALIYRYAKSMICIKKIIYIYNINSNSLMRNKYNILYIKNLIKWIEMFNKILNNRNSKILLINRLNELIIRISNNITFFKNIIDKDLEIKNKFKKIFQKMKNQYILNNSKNINNLYMINNSILSNILDILN